VENRVSKKVNRKVTNQRNANDGLTLLGKLYSTGHCNDLLSCLIQELTWTNDSCEILGRRFDIPRLQAWIADPGIRYSYSNNLIPSQAWVEPLVTIKQDIQAITGYTFNAVLLTYYRHGRDHVTWHADDEEELGDTPVIASLSLGATRQFQYRNTNDGTTRILYLYNGDLLLMHPEFQHFRQHRVPVEERIEEPRINLTFRRVLPPK